MADAALGATIQVVLETVLSFANDRLDSVLGFEEELKRLSKTAKRIQGFVADADDKKHSPGVLDWLKDLEGVVFKAENVLDEVDYENLRREVKYRGQLTRKVCFFFSFFSTIGFRLRIASKIRDINTNLKGINQEANEFGLVTKYHTEVAPSPVPAPSGATTSRQTDSVVVRNVVGRANDETKIVEMLLSPSDKVVSVIPIVGMAGVGKTTLAKSVYNNPQIDGYFPKKIWVCVAEKIKIEELFKFILESLTGEKVDADRRNTIVNKIGQELGGKRYFLVLDDVWDDRQGLWNDLFTTLEGLNTTKGSWCLVTTRLQQVASIVSKHLKMNVSPYELDKLSDDECWSILTGKVVAGEEEPNELEAIKRQILRRCGGVPLSAILIGGLLLNQGKEEWRFIVEESLLHGDQDDVKQIIKVSFDHLSPTSVKNCFAYCSLFPQDTELDKHLLIELWMAEGFLQPDSKNESLMEAVGDNCFRILLQSSLLEEVNEQGKTCYKMHDLVHDFAKSTLNEDRYLALNSSQGMAEDIIEKNTISLRTLFMGSSISGDVLSKFKCLHVLKLFGEAVKVLPTSVSKLIHLRLLDISYSKITILPESLCKLYNLQTIRIEDDKLEENLPEQMGNLISMRHLHYYDTREEFQMPSEMGRLTHLQTLKFFNVGIKDGRGVEELGSLKDLKGSLVIRNLQLVNGREGAEGAKLFEKPNLSELTFLWGSWYRGVDYRDKDVLEGLRPHRNLQKLEIRNFMGDQFPGWFINLSKLVKLEFIHCIRCRELPALGQLPSLESLELSKLEDIQSIGLSFYGISSGVSQVRKFFPALKYLSLKKMEKLVEWKGEAEVRSATGAVEVDLFPVLEILYIKRCSQLTSAPSHFPNIKKLDISGNCHISLMKRIISSITTLSSLELYGNMLADTHNDEHLSSLHLERPHHSNSLGENIECRLSLQDLKLKDFYSLTRPVGQESFVFSSLEQLKISQCRGLTSLPGEMLKACTCLQELEISSCFELTSIPGEMLESCSSLRILKVFDCFDLVSFPHDLRQTPSLEILLLYNLVSDYPKLMIAEMPRGFACLTCLRELEIGPFSINETTEFDWSGLISSSSSTLTSLRFRGLPHMKFLPEQLQYLTSLTKLRLQEVGLKALPDWIGNLASLERLELHFCYKLRDLPSMAVKRRLTKLEYLSIVHCPLLEERWGLQGYTNFKRLWFCDL